MRARSVFLVAALGAGSLGLASPALAGAPSVASMCSPVNVTCERATLAASKSDKAPYDFDWDTGWVPANSPIQVRFALKVHNRTQVNLGGTLDSTWPDPITLTPKGTMQTGLIAIDDGLEVVAQGKFTVTVLGKTYSWTGNLPGLPNVELLAKGSEKFDPWAYKEAGNPPTVSADSPTTKLAQVDLTKIIVNIPGISGGFELDGSATYSAWYDTLRLAFDEVNGVSPIPEVDYVDPSTRLLITHAPSFDTSVFIHGEVTHQVTVHLIPAFYFSILGKDFTLPLANLPVALPASAPQPWDFDPLPVHVPLPEIQVKQPEVDLGDIPVNVATSTLLPVDDIGEEQLVVDASTQAPVAFIDTTHFTVAPAQTGSVKVAITPAAAGPIDALIVVATNDPLQPETGIHIKANAVAGMGTPINEEGGCGCHAAGEAPGGTGAGLFGLALGLALVIRRRLPPS